MSSPRLYLRDGFKYTYVYLLKIAKHSSSRVECTLYTCMIRTTGLSQKKSCSTDWCMYTNECRLTKPRQGYNPRTCTHVLNEWDELVSLNVQGNTFPSILKWSYSQVSTLLNKVHLNFYTNKHLVIIQNM